MNYKQCIIVRKDLKMGTGKASAQVSHASVEATLKSDKEKVKRWRSQGMKKIVLKVNSEEELFDYKKKAEQNKLKTALITDAGKTVFKKPTITCLAIGPDKEEDIDKITKDLKML